MQWSITNVCAYPFLLFLPLRRLMIISCRAHCSLWCDSMFTCSSLSSLNVILFFPFSRFMTSILFRALNFNLQQLTQFIFVFCCMMSIIFLITCHHSYYLMYIFELFTSFCWDQKCCTNVFITPKGRSGKKKNMWNEWLKDNNKRIHMTSCFYYSF